MPFLNSSAVFSSSQSSGTVENLVPGLDNRTFTTSSTFSSCKIWVGGILQFPGVQGGITLLPSTPPHTGFITNRDIDPALEDVIIEYT